MNEHPKKPQDLPEGRDEANVCQPPRSTNAVDQLPPDADQTDWGDPLSRGVSEQSPANTTKRSKPEDEATPDESSAETVAEESCEDPPNDTGDDEDKPQDVDALEAAIRDRLKKLMARARRSKDDAKSVFAKVNPMLKTADALNEITEDRNAAVRQMVDQAGRNCDATGQEIRRKSDETRADVQLQREQLASFEESSVHGINIIEKPAEQLFLAIRDRNGELEDQVTAFGEWLDTAEQRWASTDPRTPPQDKAES